MARGIQAECGVKYTTAYQFSREHRNEIIEMIMVDGRINWSEIGSAAAGLWRKLHHGDGI